MNCTRYIHPWMHWTFTAAVVSGFVNVCVAHYTVSLWQHQDLEQADLLISGFSSSLVNYSVI